MPAILERVAETTFAQFQHKSQGKPIILIYPRHRARSALVALFLEQYGSHVIYYALTGENVTLAGWLKHMVNDAAFPEHFGSQTRAALKAKAKPEDLAAALGADLGALSSQPFALLLDCFDSLQHGKTTDRFVRALPDALPDHVQVVINARLLPLQPWNDLVLAGQAEVVGNDEAVGGGIFGDDPQRSQLEVFALSGGHVYANGRPVTSWDGSLPRLLFYYFVDHPMVTRNQIFEVFWPHMSVKEATNVFHVTKRKISERLGFELTNYASGFYVPSSRLAVHYDARVFEQSVNRAVEFEDEAPANWYRAVYLYRADFLPHIKAPWVKARRQELKNMYAQALIGLGRYYRGLGETESALGFLSRALREKPDWEDVHRDVMLIYYQTGRIDDAVAQYRQLTQTLHRMFGIQPSRETRDLYDVIAAV